MRRVFKMVAWSATALFALTEVLLFIPVAWWLYCVVAVLFALGLLRLAPVRKQSRDLMKLAAICALLAVLYLVPWSTRKPFLHDLYTIRPGMTEKQVKAIMALYMEGTGWPALPGVASNLVDLGTGREFRTGISPSRELEIANSLVFRHSNDGAFNSDWGIVTFSNNRVIRVEFAPD